MTCSEHPRGDIICDNASRSNYSITTNAYTRKNRYI